MTSRRIQLLLLLPVVAVLTACAVADDPARDRDIADIRDRPAAAILEERDDPQPVSLPEDAAPHDRLTEWWYYTGHIEDDDENLYGFQFVIFQVQRGEFAPTWAAHFAVTDTRNDSFNYAERVDTFTYEPTDVPVDLDVGGWTLHGGDGTDRISAGTGDYELEIELTAEKPVVLHEGDGFFEFAPGAESYYYSRTQMRAEGTLTVDGDERRVSGQAWFDQQWGDFLLLDDVGWDWFSVQLDTGEELMLWQSHDRQGTTLDGNATIVRQDGTAIDIPHDELQIEPIDQWRSPRTGGIYPMGWTVRIDSYDIELQVDPVMEDQELVTLESTGIIYWEGVVSASGTWGDEEVQGLGYVELTGYAEELPD